MANAEYAIDELTFRLEEGATRVWVRSTIDRRGAHVPSRWWSKRFPSDVSIGDILRFQVPLFHDWERGLPPDPDVTSPSQPLRPVRRARRSFPR